MDILITAGPTREPIDPVRYIGNRSSGRMGAALASAALASAALGARHRVTQILGPVEIAFPPEVRRIDVETAAQMQQVVLREFPSHDILIMAAAVADFRPRQVHTDKLGRSGGLTIECEPTEDILAAVGKIKRPGQRTIGFSLESTGGIPRAREKLVRKQLDLIIYNPVDTMNSANVEATLIWANGREEPLGLQSKPDFAASLIQRVASLFHGE